MVSTPVRRRPKATRIRSRSALPRLVTRQPVQVQKRELSSVTANLLSIFQALLVLAFASITLLSLAILTDKTCLPRFCDQEAVKSSSGSLGRHIKLDICNTTLASHGTAPHPVSPALAIIEQGEAMGEDIIELQTSQRRLKLYEQIGRRLALSQLQLAEPEDRTPDERKQALHRDMGHFIRSYEDFYLEELHSAVVFAAYEYCEISAFLPTMIRDAQANTSWPCRFADSWLSDIPLVEKAPQALPRAAPAVQLLEKLERTTTILSQKVRLVYHRHGRLLEDLKELNARLAEMKDDPLPSDPGVGRRP